MSGIFVSLKPSNATIRLLHNWMSENKITKPYPIDDMHCSIIYDETNHDITPNKLTSPITISPDSYKIDCLGKDHDNLVLMFNNDKISKRHEQLKKMHSIDWAFPEFNPHITLTTHVQEIKTALPLPDFDLIFTKEEVSDFNPN